MKTDHKTYWSTTALVTLHALLCAVSLCITLFRYPPESALVHWWISPPDIVALIVLTPLLFFVGTSGVALILQMVLCSLQVLALSLYTLQNMDTLVWTGSVVALVAVRLVVGFKVVRNRPFPPYERRCIS
ncbi:membrane protein of unknown function [Pseudodesulfovibrio profundus]|uniref:Uncharacterized protein n=1 Tax=Pseudodesulfovibrio profundus TaxID=57320 RepID=A0A2C8F9N2_9BACT|nr:hypothetical protein [Pseudodesulfovibrio profundus]MBC17193.1 hypothetical protein [Desulfovibrio sp.]SOB58743.1 membrane protein of unknown function [Pseudodesulfovibrio profundus]|tara:strand:- start:658 stop:1047 length:390 start_codon:yes stop_codon:yes gene_type:complete